MKHSRSLQYVRYAAWAGLALALLAAAIECVWKTLFQGGGVAGIPWLFIAVSQIAPPLTASLALGFVVVLVVWILRMLQQEPGHWQVAITAGILLLALIASSAAMFASSKAWWADSNRIIDEEASMFERSWTIVESMDIHGATYSLVTEGSLLGPTYGLVTCDQRGVSCEIVQWLGLKPGWHAPYDVPDPRLEYDRATDTLSVKVGEKVIYGYQFGPSGGAPVVPTPTPVVLGALRAMAWSPDGRRLASGWANGLILWDVETGEQLRVTESAMYVVGLTWSPDGARLAATLHPVYEQPSDGNLIGIWDAATGQGVRTLGGHGEWVYGVAWSPDGTRLASGTYLSSTIILWDVETGQKVRILPEDHGPAALRWSPDGTLLAAGYGDGVVILWEVESGRQLRTFPGGSGHHVEWSPDGTRLASYYWGYYNGHNYPEGTASVWDVQTGTQLYVLTEQHIMSGAFGWSPAGIWLATSGDNTILWDMETGERLRTLDVRSYISSWSPDGTRLATGGQGGPIIIWDVETGRQLGTLGR